MQLTMVTESVAHQRVQVEVHFSQHTHEFFRQRGHVFAGLEHVVVRGGRRVTNANASKGDKWNFNAFTQLQSSLFITENNSRRHKPIIYQLVI